LIATDFAVFHGSLAVKDGRVWRVLEGTDRVSASETIDVGGKLVLPGVVDSHVHFHFDEPGYELMEGYTAGSSAGAAGGVTTCFEMPFNLSEPTTSGALLDRKRDIVKGQSIIDYGHWGLIKRGNLDALDELHARGVVGLKAFMIDEGGLGITEGYELLVAFERASQLGEIVAVHAEDESLTRGLTARLKREGRRDPKAFADARPPAAELIAAQRAIVTATITAARTHILHVSTPQVVDAVHQARAQGVAVTCETCPHYLCLDLEDLARWGPIAACTPPLRARGIVEALWSEVLRGRVDLICSDHCSCRTELKQGADDDIWKVWAGITGIQTTLPVLFTEGVHRRGLTLESLVRMTSFNPARLYGVYPKKGHLMPGADADVVVVDPEREWTLAANGLFSRHKLSPFVGRTFRGAVDQTFVRGRLVYSRGEVVGLPGYGELVTPRTDLSSAREFQVPL
jgi:allantoinase